MRIRISQYVFSIGSPFGAGHVINEAEARALNQIRAENIRNNVKKKLDRRASGRGLSPEELAEFTLEVEAYAREYRFSLPENEQPERRTAFETELRAIAQELVETEARAQGGELSPESLSDAVEEAIKLPSVIAEAQRRVAARRAACAAVIAELIQ